MACFSPDFFSSFLPFRLSLSQIAAISSPMMSGVNSLDLNPLDYQVGGGSAGVLSQAATEAKTSS